MPLDLRNLNDNVKHTQVKFVLTELATGLTFASLARNAEGEQMTTARSRSRTAYNSALRFVDRLTMTNSEAQQVRKEMEELKKRLEELGETF